MSTPTCGELSCDECDARTVALMAERDQLRARAELAEVEVKRLGHLEAVLRSCAFDKDGTAWKTVCGWWSKKYDAVERQMSENATRAELAEAELATERARLDWLEGNASDIRKYNSRSFIWLANQNIRAAIDAAMKEDAEMSTPTPRPALKATGMRRRHARCLETELAAMKEDAIK